MAYRTDIKATLLCTIALLIHTVAYSQQVVVDDFESTDGWSFIKSDGVNLHLEPGEGVSGNGLHFDYDFTLGTGYGGIQKWFTFDLPDNFEFSFWIKADSPDNNFEIKFLDSSGENVWWVNNINYSFPTEWKKIRIKKRHISFAWGPTDNREISRVRRIEFTVASFVGGKGTVWIDDLRFQPLQPETQAYPVPRITATSSAPKTNPQNIADGASETFWQSQSGSPQSITFDFGGQREFGGLQIDWRQGKHAESFEVSISDDGREWTRVFTVDNNSQQRSFVDLSESEAGYLRLNLLKGAHPNGFGINDVKILDVKDSQTPNDFFRYVAKNSPVGDYPRYFLDQASYWNVVGPNNDVKEALINEDGMVEVGKAMYSIEPMLMIDGKLFNWSNANPTQSLNFPHATDELGFTPSVKWQCNDIEFVTGVSTSGIANLNSQLNIGYYLKNNSAQTQDFDLYLLLRPFQVNPYYQFLNLSGGVGKIYSVAERDEGNSIEVDHKAIYTTREYDLFAAGTTDEGNLVDLIRRGQLSHEVKAVHPHGRANVAIRYHINLKPGEETMFFLVVPLYHELQPDYPITNERVLDDFKKAELFWESKVNHIRFNLPPSAKSIVDTYKSNLVYILINRDRAGFQPGSRSYDRSWIRDGALTSSALLKSGIDNEVREFIQWYSAYQYDNGKVPCVVDARGPDPVPENDSHGQLIYLIREYFNFTHDTAFLRSNNEHVLKAVDYIEMLIAERSTEHYRSGNDSIRAHYGLVPESISHEGYSEKPMHSYWDNFFTLKGLKDAVEIQRVLGDENNRRRIAAIRDTFRENLYSSLEMAMRLRGIDYIPGCVELGDFDPTSTTIALTPCNEFNNLPKPQVYNTFNQYFQFFEERRDGKREWDKYTPYETRLIGSFIQLNEPQKAHRLIEYFLNHQRPRAWNHWAEVVWNDERKPGFIGDMPHTWVGSDFINAIRTMFVYENEYDSTLVVASALYQDWIDSPRGMSVENLPTYYGDISYAIQKMGNKYSFRIYGDVVLPENGMRIKNFNRSVIPKRVTVNGKEIQTFDGKQIAIHVFPAEIEIYY